MAGLAIHSRFQAENVLVDIDPPDAPWISGSSRLSRDRRAGPGQTLVRESCFFSRIVSLIIVPKDLFSMADRPRIQSKEKLLERLSPSR
ncbi:MAG TPA: hypothetical protein VMI53_12355 [Opitutaceae bacterium]|nr:hypothetical protein [Opitutaceae bacterium]